LIHLLRGFSKQPSALSGERIVKHAYPSKNGVTCNTWISHFTIAPPLIVTKEQVDVGIDAIGEGLKLADKEV
jgi:4-aminobutyrate aminotransferase-like enzyme